MDFYKAIQENKDPGALIVHVIDGDHAGEKAIVSDGEIIYSSCEEGFVSEHVAELCNAAKSRITEIDETMVYIESPGSENKLVICGAGHISMAMVDMGRMLGFEVTVADDRLQFVNNAIARGADKVLFNEFEAALSEVPGDEDTYFVIATRGHRYDRECLNAIVKKRHAYIGLLGSKRRVAIIKKELADEGVSEDIIESLHMPIGLKIGAETPEEIAVAVMAEIIEVKSRRNAGCFEKDVMAELLKEERDEIVLSTIVNKKGSAPRETGTRMIVKKDGSIIGTIGGGCIEGGVIAKSRRMLTGSESGPVLMDVDVTTEAAEDEGMVCGGKASLLYTCINSTSDASLA